MCCKEDVRKEFRLNNFGLSHNSPNRFSTLECGPLLGHVIWLIPWIPYFWVTTVIDATLLEYRGWQGAKWLTLLSNWDYILLDITSAMDMLCAIVIACKRKDIVKGECSETPWYLKVLWIFYNVINTVAIFVTLLYWTLLPPKHDHSSINKHVVNSVFVILGICITAKPIRLYHVYQPMVFAVIYLVFSVIYQNAGGGVIYKPLDWDTPGRTFGVAVGVVFVAVPIIHTFCFFLSKLRQLIGRNCCKRKTNEIKSNGGNTVKLIEEQTSF
ncbi:hypothetical protein ACJMK2_016380 [Sinanodonta woodiana]|uniref:Uncharacterized protein n=1 Tax=Sinanodonta woodiana TaxID=1069815 RepID=A0ABD3UTF5_SINWO